MPHSKFKKKKKKTLNLKLNFFLINICNYTLTMNAYHNLVRITFNEICFISECKSNNMYRILHPIFHTSPSMCFCMVKTPKWSGKYYVREGVTTSVKKKNDAPSKIVREEIFPLRYILHVHPILQFFLEINPHRKEENGF